MQLENTHVQFAEATMHFLKIKGRIPKNKQTEFEQTFRLAGTQIPESCAGFSINQDPSVENEYLFVSYWPFPESIEEFTRSTAYMLLVGAFKNLGELEENYSGEISPPGKPERK